MKILLSLFALSAIFVAGCGAPKDASGAPLDSKRPPSPPPPSNGVAPTSGPLTDPGASR